MATIKHFEDIKSWQKARELCKIIEEIIDKGKFRHSYKLIEQVENSSGSIMDNIAEGFERGGNREFIQFLSTSKGSCGEIQDHLYTAMDEQYVSKKEFDELYAQAAEVGRLIGGFMKYLQGSEIRGNKFRSQA